MTDGRRDLPADALARGSVKTEDVEAVRREFARVRRGQSAAVRPGRIRIRMARTDRGIRAERLHRFDQG